jgi:hypothetical protein
MFKKKNNVESAPRMDGRDWSKERQGWKERKEEEMAYLDALLALDREGLDRVARSRREVLERREGRPREKSTPDSNISQNRNGAGSAEQRRKRRMGTWVSSRSGWTQKSSCMKEKKA